MIDVKNVSVTYKKNKVKILENVSFQVAKGEIVALLGHNGSGKSTLLKCITGVIKPITGEILVGSVDSFKDQKKLRKKMGVLFNQKPSFIIDLEVIDNLYFFKEIYEIKDKEFQEKLNFCNQYLDIKNLYHKQYRKLSYGERVKCEIISILLHQPEYIYLDEPTNGLDLQAKKNVYNLLVKINELFNSTIIIVTHEVEYLQSYCDRAIILSDGEVLYDASADELNSIISHEKLMRITYTDILSKDKQNELSNRCVETGNHLGIYKYESEKEKSDILKIAADAFDITNIEIENTGIKEVYEYAIKKRNSNTKN
jgi:ABC-2 type transport system ATP-binding protein